jgi:hypothetical protein
MYGFFGFHIIIPKKHIFVRSDGVVKYYNSGVIVFVILPKIRGKWLADRSRSEFVAKQ